MMLISSTEKLEHRVAELTERSTATAVGRASWGLFMLLTLWKKDGVTQKIALPSFLCQSPLVAILLAGWEPVFCDVDLETGNVSNFEWEYIIESGVNAVLFVHLFGNVGDAGRIADICRAKGVYFIEDAAQSFGGSWDKRPCGSYGDAAILSFGHTKVIDVEHGGMVLTNDYKLAKDVRDLDRNYSKFNLNTSAVATQFREKFYAARRQLGSAPEIARTGFKGLARICEPLIPSRWRPEVSEEILVRLNHLDLIVRERREKSAIYEDMLRDTAMVPLSMSPESVPWRAVFRVSGINFTKQGVISEAIRLEGIDVSNWYIPSHWLMEDDCIQAGKLGSTERLSKEIFQFWIDNDTSIEKVKHVALVVKRKLKELDYG